MEYSLNINFFTKNCDMAEAAHAVKSAGFTALDYTPPVRREDWKETLYRDLDIFAKEGLKVNQTHCPFNRYGSCGDRHPLLVERTVEATEIAGAPYMVVHGDEFKHKEVEYTPEKGEQYNYEYFAPFLEKAAGKNIVFAFEILFQDKHPEPRHCQTAEQLRGLIERFNSEYAKCCWDFGHANVAFGKEQAEKIKQLAPYIVCTHVHDNFGGIDMHMMPLWCDVNWQGCIGAIKEQPYTGTMNLEFSHGSIPKELVDINVQAAYQTVSYLWEHY